MRGEIGATIAASGEVDIARCEEGSAQLERRTRRDSERRAEGGTER